MNSEPQDTAAHRSNPRGVDDHSAPRELIDIAALAERLGVTPRFIRRLTAEDRVPFLKIGKFVRFDPREIDQWVDERRRPTTAPLR